MFSTAHVTALPTSPIGCIITYTMSAKARQYVSVTSSLVEPSLIMSSQCLYEKIYFSPSAP